MKLIAIFGSALSIGIVALAAEMGAPATNAVPESLATMARKVRPDFLLGSFASGLDFTRPGNPPLADFFRRNFNIMTVGIYMTGTQRERGAYNFEKTDALIQFAEQNHLQVYLHPMIGGAEYTPKWVNEGGFSSEALQQLMRDRITSILTRYQGRIHYVDVVNESLTGQGRKADGQFEWQEKAYRGGDHVWFKTLGMYQGKKHQFPRYLVEAFRIAREVGGPDLKLILNEWGNETTKSPRGHAFLALIQALKEEGLPVDGAGLQLHCRLKDGQLHGWANNQPFDFDAFDAMLKLYEQAGIEVHITEFDIHLGANPTPQDFELQGKHYAEMLRHALQSPAVKSFKTWGFTDRDSWKADGVDGHPLLLDENLQPKPAYLRQVEMLRVLAPKVTMPAAQAASARQTATATPRLWTLGERDGRQCLITPEGKPFLMLGLSHVGGAFTGVPQTEHAALKDKIESELRGWGFNTVPSPEFWGRFPFIVPLDRLVGAGENRFEDVFDPAFKARLREKIGAACARTKNNPNCIGYWWTDIPPWPLIPIMNKRDQNWVEFIRDLPATAPGRQRYEAFLKSGGSHQDIDFLRLIARELYTDTAAIFEELDPERLIFGERYNTFNVPREILEEAAKVVDVISVQPYEGKFSGAKYDEWHQFTGKPIVISDWNLSFPTPEHSVTMWPQFKTPAGAAEAYEAYLRAAFAKPYVLGYFKCQYVDQVLPTGMLKQGLHKQDGTTYEEFAGLLKTLHQRLVEQLENERRLAR